MKRLGLIILGMVVLIAIAAFLIFRSSPVATQSLESPANPAKKVQRGLTVIDDPAEVFQKAFWRRPADEDRIHHAERREWTNEAGELVRWSWFVSLSPGPDLVEWLGTNPFSLATVSPSEITFDRTQYPAWFLRDMKGFQIQQSLSGHFTLIFSREQNRLFATDSGAGFEQPQIDP